MSTIRRAGYPSSDPTRHPVRSVGPIAFDWICSFAFPCHHNDHGISLANPAVRRAIGDAYLGPTGGKLEICQALSGARPVVRKSGERVANARNTRKKIRSARVR